MPRASKNSWFISCALLLFNAGRLSAVMRQAAVHKEDIDFDIYKKARKLMESGCMIVLPQQEVQAGCVHLRLLRVPCVGLTRQPAPEGSGVVVQSA